MTASLVNYLILQSGEARNRYETNCTLSYNKEPVSGHYHSKGLMQKYDHEFSKNASANKNEQIYNCHNCAGSQENTRTTARLNLEQKRPARI